MFLLQLNLKMLEEEYLMKEELNDGFIKYITRIFYLEDMNCNRSTKL